MLVAGREGGFGSVDLLKTGEKRPGRARADEARLSMAEPLARATLKSDRDGLHFRPSFRLFLPLFAGRLVVVGSGGSA